MKGSVGGVNAAIRRLGVIDSDVLRDPANADRVLLGMKQLGAKNVAQYTIELAKLAVKARQANKLRRVRAIAGAAGSGKSSLAMGVGANDNASLRKTIRSNILSPQDLDNVDEVTAITANVSDIKLKEYLKDVDRAYALSSSTREEQELIRRNKDARDITGQGLYGREPGTTRGVSTDFAAEEATLIDELGSKNVVLGRRRDSQGNLSRSLRIKRGSELPEIVQAKGFYRGAFAPSTLGHRGAFDVLFAKMLEKNPNAKLEDILVAVAPNLPMIEGKEGLAHATRYGIFDEDIRYLLAGINFRGAMVSKGSTNALAGSLPRVMEVPSDSDRRRFARIKGSMAVVAGKDEGILQSYEKAGIKVSNIPRIDDISGTQVRDLLFAERYEELSKIVNPEILSILRGNQVQLKNRSVMAPVLLEQAQKASEVNTQLINQKIQETLSSAPGGPYSRMTKQLKEAHPDIVDKIEIMKKNRDTMKKQAVGVKAYSVIRQLAREYPSIYGIDPSRSAGASAGYISAEDARSHLGDRVSKSILGDISPTTLSPMMAAIKSSVPAERDAAPAEKILPPPAQVLKALGIPIIKTSKKNTEPEIYIRGRRQDAMLSPDQQQVVNKINDMYWKKVGRQDSAAKAQETKRATKGLSFAAAGLLGSPFDKRTFVVSSDKLKNKDVTVDAVGGVVDKESAEVALANFNRVNNIVSDAAEGMRNINTRKYGASLATATAVKSPVNVNTNSSIQGGLIEEVIKELGGPGALKGQGMDFPMGLQGAAKYFRDKSGNTLPPDLPTDAKRTISGPSTIKDNIITYLRSKGYNRGGVIRAFKAGGATFGTGEYNFPARIAKSYETEMKDKVLKQAEHLDYPEEARVRVDPDKIKETFEQTQFDKNRFLASMSGRVGRSSLYRNMVDFARFIGLPQEDLLLSIPENIDFKSKLEHNIFALGTFDRTGLGVRKTEGYDLGQTGFSTAQDQDLYGYQKLLEQKKKEALKISQTPVKTYDDGSFSYDSDAFRRANEETDSIRNKVANLTNARYSAESSMLQRIQDTAKQTGRGTVSVSSRNFGKVGASNTTFYHELTHQLINGFRTRSAESFEKYKARVVQLFGADNNELAEAFDKLESSYSSADVVYGRSYKIGLLDKVIAANRTNKPVATTPLAAQEALDFWAKAQGSRKAVEFKPINPGVNKAILDNGVRQSLLERLEDSGKEEFLTTLVQNANKLDSVLQEALNSTLDEMFSNAGVKRQKYNSGGFVSRFAVGGIVPAMVSSGEAYVPPDLAKSIGYGTLNRMNQADRNGMTGFSGGGVSVFRGPGSGTSDSIGPIGLPEGSFILRQKATEALGLASGGKVRRFADGGSLRPGVINKSTVIADRTAVASLDSLSSALQAMGLNASKSAELVKSGANISYEAIEKAMAEDIKRLKLVGASSVQIAQAEESLRSVREKGESTIEKQKNLEGAFSQRSSGATRILGGATTVGDLGNNSGAAQEAIKQQAEMIASARIESYKTKYGEISSEQEERIRDKSYVKAASRITGISEKDYKKQNISGSDIQQYIQQSMMDRKTLGQMDKQLVQLKIAEYQNAGRTASEARRAAEQEIKERRAAANAWAREQGMRGPGGTGIRGSLGQMGAGIMSFGSRIENSRFNTGLRGAIGGQPGFMASMALGALAGQGENIFGKETGKRDNRGMLGASGANAFTAAGLEAGTTTLSAGLATASSLAMIPGVGPFAAALTLGVTAVSAWTNAVEAGKKSAEDFATAQRQKGIDDSGDKLTKSLEIFQKNSGSATAQSNVIKDASSLSRQITEKSAADIAIAQRRKGETRSWNDYFMGVEKPTLGANEIAEISKQSAKAAEPAADTARRVIEARLQSGSTMADISSMPDFKSLVDNIAAANPEFIVAKNNIMSMSDATVATTGATREQLIAARLSVIQEKLKNDASYKAIESTMLAAKAMDEANKKGRELAMSFDRMATSFNQSLGRVSFESDQRESLLSNRASVYAGDAKIGAVSSRDANILKNPKAYSAAERDAAENRASSFFGKESGVVKQMLGINATDFGQSVKQAVQDDLIGAKSGIGNANLSLEQASATARKNLEAQLASAPSNVRDEILTKFNAIVGKIDDQQGLTAQQKVDKLIEEVDSQLGNAASDAAKKVQEMAVAVVEFQNGALNRLIERTNAYGEAQAKAREYFDQARDIRISGNDQIRAARGEAPPSAMEMRARLNSRVSRLSGGATDAASIRANIERDMASFNAMQERLTELGNNLDPSDKKQEREIVTLTSRMQNLSRSIDDGKKALDLLADGGNVAAAAFERIKTIQQNMEGQGEFLDKLATSSPEEATKLSNSFARLNNYLNGNISSAQNSYEAQEAFMRTLQETGNPYAAQNAGMSVMAQQRGEALALFKELIPVFRAQLSAQGVADPNRQISEMFARLRTGLYAESGMLSNPMLAELSGRTIGFTRDMTNNPEINALLGLADQSFNDQAGAKIEAGALALSNAATIMKEAVVNFQKAAQELSDRFSTTRAADTKSSGGMIYASTGKLINFQPKGTDTVPAMLTPGEFVVNARATAQNLPLLESINSGSKGYSRGGVVYLSSGGLAPGAIGMKGLEDSFTTISNFSMRRPIPPDMDSSISDNLVKTLKSGLFAIEREAMTSPNKEDNQYISRFSTDIDSLLNSKEFIPSKYNDTDPPDIRRYLKSYSKLEKDLEITPKSLRNNRTDSSKWWLIDDKISKSRLEALKKSKESILNNLEDPQIISPFDDAKTDYENELEEALKYISSTINSIEEDEKRKNQQGLLSPPANKPNTEPVTGLPIVSPVWNNTTNAYNARKTSKSKTRTPIKSKPVGGSATGVASTGFVPFINPNDPLSKEIIRGQSIAKQLKWSYDPSSDRPYMEASAGLHMDTPNGGPYGITGTVIGGKYAGYEEYTTSGKQWEPEQLGYMNASDLASLRAYQEYTIRNADAQKSQQDAAKYRQDLEKEIADKASKDDSLGFNRINAEAREKRKRADEQNAKDRARLERQFTEEKIARDKQTEDRRKTIKEKSDERYNKDSKRYNNYPIVDKKTQEKARQEAQVAEILNRLNIDPLTEKVFDGKSVINLKSLENKITILNNKQASLYGLSTEDYKSLPYYRLLREAVIQKTSNFKRWKKQQIEDSNIEYGILKKLADNNRLTGRYWKPTNIGSNPTGNYYGYVSGFESTSGATSDAERYAYLSIIRGLKPIDIASGGVAAAEKKYREAWLTEQQRLKLEEEESLKFAEDIAVSRYDTSKSFAANVWEGLFEDDSRRMSPGSLIGSMMYLAGRDLYYSESAVKPRTLNDKEILDSGIPQFLGDITSPFNMVPGFVTTGVGNILRSTTLLASPRAAKYLPKSFYGNRPFLENMSRSGKYASSVTPNRVGNIPGVSISANNAAREMKNAIMAGNRAATPNKASGLPSKVRPRRPSVSTPPVVSDTGVTNTKIAEWLAEEADDIIPTAVTAAPTASASSVPLPNVSRVLQQIAQVSPKAKTQNSPWFPTFVAGGKSLFGGTKWLLKKIFDWRTLLGTSSLYQGYNSYKQAQNKALGGIIYASNGTLVPYEPKGTDTVPAMLTPGEFVVNAKSTAQHLPLLKSINSGAMSRGGVVYAQKGRKIDTASRAIDYDTKINENNNRKLEAYINLKREQANIPIRPRATKDQELEDIVRFLLNNSPSELERAAKQYPRINDILNKIRSDKNMEERIGAPLPFSSGGPVYAQDGGLLPYIKYAEKIRNSESFDSSNITSNIIPKTSVLENRILPGGSDLSDGMGAIEAIGHVLGTGGAAVRALLSGKPVSDILDFSGEGMRKRVSGRDLLRNYGMAGKNDSWLNFAGGMLTETLSEPSSIFGLAKMGIKSLGSARKNPKEFFELFHGGPEGLSGQVIRPGDKYQVGGSPGAYATLNEKTAIGYAVEGGAGASRYKVRFPGNPKDYVDLFTKIRDLPPQHMRALQQISKNTGVNINDKMKLTTFLDQAYQILRQKRIEAVGQNSIDAGMTQKELFQAFIDNNIPGFRTNKENFTLLSPKKGSEFYDEKLLIPSNGRPRGQFKPPPPPPPPPLPKKIANQSRGGIIYASQGQYVNFQPKGTDTVPAMLTPGEFVVNARATKQHLPLLHAINNGQESTGYSSGGVAYLVNGGIAERYKGPQIQRETAANFAPSNIWAVADKDGLNKLLTAELKDKNDNTVKFPDWRNSQFTQALNPILAQQQLGITNKQMKSRNIQLIPGDLINRGIIAQTRDTVKNILFGDTIQTLTREVEFQKNINGINDFLFNTGGDPQAKAKELRDKLAMVIEAQGNPVSVLENVRKRYWYLQEGLGNVNKALDEFVREGGPRNPVEFIALNWLSNQKINLEKETEFINDVRKELDLLDAQQATAIDQKNWGNPNRITVGNLVNPVPLSGFNEVVPKNFRSGGIVYANNGALISAQNRGTDTVPAMLTPGEFVVNRQAAQQHMPVLNAINNGYYNRGGIVQYLNNGGVVAPRYYADAGIVGGSQLRGSGNGVNTTGSSASQEAPRWLSELDEKINKVSTTLQESLGGVFSNLNNMANQLSTVAQELPREMSITSNINKNVNVNGVSGEWSKYQGDILKMAGDQSVQERENDKIALSKWSEGQIPVV